MDMSIKLLKKTRFTCLQPESDPPPGQMCITTTVCKAQYCRNFTAELQSFVCDVQHATIQVNIEPPPPTKGTEFNSGFSVCRESCLRDFYINTPQRSLFFFSPCRLQLSRKSKRLSRVAAASRPDL